jgi:hypothetical protein
MFLGILIFSEAFPLFENLYYAEPLGPVKVFDVLGMSEGLFAFLLIIVALVAFVVTAWIQKRVKKVDY